MSIFGWLASRGWRAIALILGLAALLVATHIVAREIADFVGFQIRPSNEDMVHRMIMTLALVYSILLAVPFVPGVEIGLALMAALGPPIVFLVYMCTIAGLAMSFLVGQYIPTSTLIRLASAAGLDRLAGLLRELEPLGREARLERLVSRTPNRMVPVLLKHRHLALAAAFNLPGNFVIGGGGGIALLAGFSRLYSVQGYMATVCLAVAPVPLMVLVFGKAFLSV